MARYSEKAQGISQPPGEHLGSTQGCTALADVPVDGGSAACGEQGACRRGNHTHRQNIGTQGPNNGHKWSRVPESLLGLGRSLVKIPVRGWEHPTGKGRGTERQFKCCRKVGHHSLLFLFYKKKEVLLKE